MTRAIAAPKRHFRKLDAIRGAACLYVLAHNAFYVLYPLGIVPESAKIFLFAGSEVVMVFFMLSGFLIATAVARYSQQDFKTYFLRRFLRIYVPLLFSFAVSVAIAAVNNNLKDDFSWRQLVGNLLLLQDFGVVKPGIWIAPFLGNLPLWSLSYEWWCYMLFYPLYRAIAAPIPKIYFVTGLSALCYVVYTIFPNTPCLIGTYLAIWWCGVEMAEIYHRDRQFSWGNLRPVTRCLGALCGLSFVPVFFADSFQPGYYPFLVFRHFFAALFFIAIGVFWYRKKLVYFEAILGRFAKLAPISYSLYILQFPILFQLDLGRYNVPPGIGAIAKLLTLFALAYAIDVKLQPWVSRRWRFQLKVKS